MSTIKDWLELAKQHELRVVHEADTDGLALCINLISIPTTDTVAVTVTFMENRRKKGAAESKVFARTMGSIEQVLRIIDDEGYTWSDRFQPVALTTKWYRVLSCHRIFFITESSVSAFFTELTKEQRLKLLKGKMKEIKEVRIIARTSQHQFNIKV